MKYRFESGAVQYVVVHSHYISAEDFVAQLTANLFGRTTPTCRFEVVDREEGELMDTVHDVAVVREVKEKGVEVKEKRKRKCKRKRRWRSRSREIKH